MSEVRRLVTVCISLHACEGACEKLLKANPIVALPDRPLSSEELLRLPPAAFYIQGK